MEGFCALLFYTNEVKNFCHVITAGAKFLLSVDLEQVRYGYSFCSPALAPKDFFEFAVPPAYKKLLHKFQ